MWFEAMSGLRINLNTSKIIPVGAVDNVAKLALELGSRIGSLPTLYLGLPWELPTRLLGFGTLSKKGFRRGWPHGRHSIFLRVEALL